TLGPTALCITKSKSRQNFTSAPTVIISQRMVRIDCSKACRVGQGRVSECSEFPSQSCLNSQTRVDLAKETRPTTHLEPTLPVPLDTAINNLATLRQRAVHDS